MHLRACCWLHTEISMTISVHSIMLNAGLCTLESRHDGKDSRVRWRLRSVTIPHHAAFCGRQTFLSLGFWNSSSHIAASTCCASPQHNHGRLHIGANGVSWPPGKKLTKNWKAKTCKKIRFLCLCYILRAIRAGRCRERRYADHIFIQIYFRMHHSVVKFSKFSSPQAARGHWPLNQKPADVPEP